MLSIIGWMVIYCTKEEDEPEHFKLTSGDGSVYKYQATSPSAAVWVQRLQTASTQQHPKVRSLLYILCRVIVFISTSFFLIYGGLGGLKFWGLRS